MVRRTIVKTTAGKPQLCQRVACRNGDAQLGEQGQARYDHRIFQPDENRIIRKKILIDAQRELIRRNQLFDLVQRQEGVIQGVEQGNHKHRSQNQDQEPKQNFCRFAHGSTLLSQS